MGEPYSMEDIGIESLIGRKVLSTKINSENDLVILETDKGNLYLTWEGDCCAHCYLLNVSGAENLLNAVILEATNAEWKNISEEEYEVIESMGTNIKTSKGYVTFESRVEHNGYYGGSIIVSDDEPVNQYHSPRYDKDDLGKLELKPLRDF